MNKLLFNGAVLTLFLTMNKDTLPIMFANLIYDDQKTLVNCKRVCKEWNELVNKMNINTCRYVKFLIQTNSYIEIDECADNPKLYYYIGRYNKAYILRKFKNISNDNYIQCFRGAISGGHEKLIRLMIIIRPLNIHSQEYYYAGKSGNIQIIEYMNKKCDSMNSFESRSLYIMKGACKNNHMNVLKYLSENKKDYKVNDWTWTQNIRHIKDYDIFLYVFNNCNTQLSEVICGIINECSHSGEYCAHRKILDQHLSSGAMIYWDDIMVSAINGGNIDIVKMAIPHVEYLSSMFNFYSSNNTDILKLLIDNYRENIYSELKLIPTGTSIFHSMSYEVVIVLLEEYPAIADEIRNYILALMIMDKGNEHKDRMKILKYLEKFYDFNDALKGCRADLEILTTFPQYFDINIIFLQACREGKNTLIEALVKLDVYLDIENGIIEYERSPDKYGWSVLNLLIKNSYEGSLVNVLSNKG